MRANKGTTFTLKIIRQRFRRDTSPSATHMINSPMNEPLFIPMNSGSLLSIVSRYKIGRKHVPDRRVQLGITEEFDAIDSRDQIDHVEEICK